MVVEIGLVALCIASLVTLYALGAAFVGARRSRSAGRCLSRAPVTPRWWHLRS